MAVDLEEKSQLASHLQEKVTTLEKRLEGDLSGEDYIWELLREVTLSSPLGGVICQRCFFVPLPFPIPATF